MYQNKKIIYINNHYISLNNIDALFIVEKMFDGRYDRQDNANGVNVYSIYLIYSGNYLKLNIAGAEIDRITEVIEKYNIFYKNKTQTKIKIQASSAILIYELKAGYIKPKNLICDGNDNIVVVSNNKAVVLSDVIMVNA